MDFPCPSCGRSHRTEDHKDDFEFECQCGYVIIKPNEAQMNADATMSWGEQPAAADKSISRWNDLEAGLDSAMNNISEATSPGLQFDEKFSGASIPALDQLMSSPSQLPDAMPYDRFELDQQEHTALAQDVSSAQAEETKQTGQKIVSRLQMASVEQYLGPDFDLILEDMDEQKIKTLQQFCLELIRDRPWLEMELEQRSLSLRKIESWSQLKRVPEVLAVEIYIRTYVLGGRCKFTPSI